MRFNTGSIPAFLLTAIICAAMIGFLAPPTWAQGSSLVLSQEEDENTVGEAHTVMAVASVGDSSLAGVAVTFTVLGGPNAGATGTCAPTIDCTTDTTGSVSFTYLGEGGAGTDSIQAYFIEGEDDTVYSNILEKMWIVENMPPVAACKDTTLSAGEDCEVSVSIDDGSYDPDGDPITLTQVPPGPYPVGMTEVMLIVADSTGAADTCTATVTAVDDVPPEIDVALNHEYLWPPNHKMWEICATVTVTDCSADSEELSWILESVTSNEPDNQKKGGGDGNTDNDIQLASVGEEDSCLLLRAERKGNGTGRIYTLVFSASDSSGNSASDTVEVHVAHDQGGKDDDNGDDSNGEDEGEDEATADGPTRGLGLSAEEYGAVRIQVFDVRGRRVQEFMLNMAAEESWDLGWDGKTSSGRQAPSGIYFYRITTPLREMVRRIVIAR